MEQQLNLGIRVYGEQVMSPPGLMQFGHIASPDTKQVRNGVPKYKYHHLMPKDTTDFSALNNAAWATAIAHADKNKLARPTSLAEYANPFRDGDAKADKNYEGFAGSLYIIPTSTNKPTVLAPDGITVIDASELYNGCLVRVWLTPASYTDNLKIQDPQTGIQRTIVRPGVNFYMEYIQLCERRPRFMNRPTVDPSTIFGQWGQNGAQSGSNVGAPPIPGTVPTTGITAAPAPVTAASSLTTASAVSEVLSNGSVPVVDQMPQVTGSGTKMSGLL